MFVDVAFLWRDEEKVKIVDREHCREDFFSKDVAASQDMCR
jgi:hypothetical protein